jgi:hypothetical protein
MIRHLLNSAAVAESPAYCKNPADPAPDLQVPDLQLDLDSFGLDLQGSENDPSEKPLWEKQKEFEDSKQWWSIERIPFLPYAKEHWCDKELGLVPVCCLGMVNKHGVARRCIYCTSNLSWELYFRDLIFRRSTPSSSLTRVHIINQTMVLSVTG